MIKVSALIAVNVMNIMQMHSSQMGCDENVTEGFDVNPTEMVKSNKCLITGDFSAQAGNDAILVSQVK